MAATSPAPADKATPTPGPLAALGSPVGLGRAVVALLCLVILSDVAAIAASLNLGRVVESLTNDGFGEYSYDDAEMADVWMTLTSGFAVVAYLATGVVFLVWFYRVRKNAQVFAPHLLTWRQGWTVGGWFVPFANLVIPALVAGQVWGASLAIPDRRNRGPVALWWIGFLASCSVGTLADRQFGRAESELEIISATESLVTAGFLDIAAAVLAIVFVHKLTQMQHAKALRGPVPVAV